MTLKNNRAPLLSNIKLYASFHHHVWIQTGVTVRKRLSWVVTSVTLTFDLWPWPFAWTLRWSLVITPENFMMIRWWEHSQKGVTDRRTDGRTDRQTENTICRAAWSQLKICFLLPHLSGANELVSFFLCEAIDTCSKFHAFITNPTIPLFFCTHRLDYLVTYSVKTKSISWQLMPGSLCPQVISRYDISFLLMFWLFASPRQQQAW